MTASLHAEDEGVAALPRAVSGDRWQLREADARRVAALQQAQDLSYPLARVLALRDVPPEAVASFLAPRLRDSLPDPLHLKDMSKAVERVVQAITQQEQVVVFGDYDVDGATSTALLLRFFRAVGLVATYYIPDRMTEGYGPSAKAMEHLHRQGAELVITVDCGTVAKEALAHADSLGMDVIVLDHHLGGEALPPAVAVVNPNRVDEGSPYRDLAAVGVSFLLAVAVNQALRALSWYHEERREPALMDLLDLVALGTVCDVMPLTGLNRTYVVQGLKVMARRANMGLAALADVAGLEEAPGVYHAGFLLGPRINAGGRVGKSSLGTQLLLSEQAQESTELAAQLDRLNKERQAIEQQVLEEAVAQADAIAEEAPVVLVAGEHWHPGVIGIVAGRIKERTGKPSAVIAWEKTPEGGVIGKASARSIAGVDIGAAIGRARQEGLLLAGGGHAMAGGFTVEQAQFGALKDFFAAALAQDVVTARADRVRYTDLALPLSGVTLALLRELAQAGPFGMGNPVPRLLLRDVGVGALRRVGQTGKHLMVQLTQPSAGKQQRLKAMAFGCEEASPLAQALEKAAKEQQMLHVVATARIGMFRGQQQIDCTLEDVMVVR